MNVPKKKSAPVAPPVSGSSQLTIDSPPKKKLAALATAAENIDSDLTQLICRDDEGKLLSVSVHAREPYANALLVWLKRAEMNTIKNAPEIQAAHDRLTAIILGEIPNPWAGQPGIHERLCAATDVLCWVLNHDHNVNFAENLKAIDALMAERGYSLVKLDEERTQ